MAASSFSKLDNTVKNNTIVNTKPTKSEISCKARGLLHSSLPNLFIQQTLQSQATIPSPQPMNQFRLHKVPQTQGHNERVPNHPLHPLSLPPLTAIASISYSTITRPCMLQETSCISGVILIPDLLLFCAILDPFHPNKEI